jgi:hypothetical protein
MYAKYSCTLINIHAVNYPGRGLSQRGHTLTVKPKLALETGPSQTLGILFV